MISGFEAIQAIQQVGRIRLQSPEKTVRLFVCRYTAEFFNRKRHSFHMKRNALRIPQSGNQERIIAYFLENDGQYIRDLAIRSLSEHFIVIILQYTHLNLILLNWMITSGVGRRMKLVTLKSP